MHQVSLTRERGYDLMGYELQWAITFPLTSNRLGTGCCREPATYTSAEFMCASCILCGHGCSLFPSSVDSDVAAMWTHSGIGLNLVSEKHGEIELFRDLLKPSKELVQFLAIKSARHQKE